MSAVPANLVLQLRRDLQDTVEPYAYQTSFLEAELDRARQILFNLREWDGLTYREQHLAERQALAFILQAVSRVYTQLSLKYQTVDEGSEVSIDAAKAARELRDMAEDLLMEVRQETGIRVGISTKAGRITRARVPAIGNVPPGEDRGKQPPKLYDVESDDIGSTWVTLRWVSMISVGVDLWRLFIWIKPQSTADWSATDHRLVTIPGFELDKVWHKVEHDGRNIILTASTAYDARLEVEDLNGRNVFSNTVQFTTAAAT